MPAFTKSGEEISFNVSCVAAYAGQLDLILLARVGGRSVGGIEYSEFEGNPSVKLIAVHKEARREGVGTEMVLHLQSLYPDRQIHFGMLTDDGVALLDTIPHRTETPEERTRLLRRLEVLKREDARCSSACEAFDDLARRLTPSETARNELTRTIGNWDETRNEIEAIEADLRNYPERIILERPEREPVTAPGL